jgi:hypothetical protein
MNGSFQRSGGGSGSFGGLEFSILQFSLGISGKFHNVMSVDASARNLCFYLSIFQEVTGRRIDLFSSILFAGIVFATLCEMRYCGRFV